MTVRPFVPFVLPGIVCTLRFGPFEYLIVRGSVAKKLQKKYPDRPRRAAIAANRIAWVLASVFGTILYWAILLILTRLGLDIPDWL